MKKLTSKEKLFCILYTEGRNARDAAARAGLDCPSKTALKLLEREEVRTEISILSNERAADLNEVCAGYRRLAFGSCADALKLLYAEECLCEDDLERLDLFNVSEIKKPKDGALELKFFDRLKALEHLESLCGKAATDDSALPFYAALEKSAENDHGKA